MGIGEGVESYFWHFVKQNDVKRLIIRLILHARMTWSDGDCHALISTPLWIRRGAESARRGGCS